VARRQYIRECFEEILDVASQPGVHHKMAANMEDILILHKSCELVVKVGGDKYWKT